MKLRSLLHRRHADHVPLLPASDPDDGPSARGPSPRSARDERLERLLTPTELDLVRHHRL